MKRLLAWIVAQWLGLGWLHDGSLLVWERRTDALARWVRRGRRPDLPGWRGMLGPLARLAVLGGLALLVWAIVRAIPWLMWLLTGWWIRAAWKASRKPPAEPEEDAPATPAADPRTVLILWLDRLTRDRSGIHLGELHQALARHPHLAGLKRAEMRAWLDRHHITVDRTLRVGAVAGRSGVSRATIEALLKTLSPTTETSRVESVVHASDLGDCPVESGVESGGESGVEPHFADVERLFT